VRRITAKSQIRERQDCEQPRRLTGDGSSRAIDPSVGGRSSPFLGCWSLSILARHSHTSGVAPLLAMIGVPVSTTVCDHASQIPSERSIVDTAQAERIEAICERLGGS
jgi:hypothetical protein